MLLSFFSQSASFSEQIRETISLSEIDSYHKLLIKVRARVTAYVTWSFWLE